MSAIRRAARAPPDALLYPDWHRQGSAATPQAGTAPARSLPPLSCRSGRVRSRRGTGDHPPDAVQQPCAEAAEPGPRHACGVPSPAGGGTAAAGHQPHRAPSRLLPAAPRVSGWELRIAEQGQITDRYNAAITNLGSSSTDVRLGGIYALQRLMQDSPRDQPTVIAVLCAFVRDQAPATATPAGTSLESAGLPTDIQAALTVITSRNTANDDSATVVDLSYTQLVGARLTDANLSNAFLFGANLSYARLPSANLSNAFFGGANLSHADLSGADLSGTTGIGT